MFLDAKLRKHTASKSGDERGEAGTSLEHASLMAIKLQVDKFCERKITEWIWRCQMPVW